MATQQRVSDDREVADHYATQVALTAALVAALRRLRPALDAGDVPGSLGRYRTGVRALVERFSMAAVSLNADYFEALREQAGIADTFRVPIVDPPFEQLDKTLDWSLNAPTISGGDTALYEPAPVDTVTIVVDRTESAMQKVVMDAGRNELIAAIEADTKARGWARVTKPDACYFCRMLATRGAVYENQFTAGRAANKRFKGDGEFKFHDNCHCTLQPLFGQSYEAPAHTRADEQLWRDSTAGLSGQAAINAFRRAVAAQNRAA